MRRTGAPAQAKRASVLWAAAGPSIWLAHLGVVYAVTAVACARNFELSTLSFLIAATTLVAWIACAAVLICALRGSSHFLGWLAGIAAAFSLVAIAWTATPALVLQTCL